MRLGSLLKLGSPRALLACCLVLAGCDGRSRTQPLQPVTSPASSAVPDVSPTPLSAPAPGENVVDAVVAPMLAASGLPVAVERDDVLCRRLAIDLTGLPPTLPEIAAHCAGRTPGEMAVYFMEKPSGPHVPDGSRPYVYVNRRWWADRFQYQADLNETKTFWRYVRDLDAIVGKLYSGQIRYDELTRRALASPAFARRFGVFDQNRDLVQVAGQAYRVFLGREALPPEAEDFGNLWRAWTPIHFDHAPSVALYADDCPKDVPGKPDACQHVELGLDADACAGTRRAMCQSTVLGPAEVVPTGTLLTGFRAGQNGVVTAMHHALREQLGKAFDAAYPLPAVVVGESAWSFGVGDHQRARPIFLSGPAGLPSARADGEAPAWAARAEAELDRGFQLTRQDGAAQAASNLISDKHHAATHLPQLLDPALRMAVTPPPTAGPVAPSAASPTLGTLVDGTPVSNDMLAEVFALASSSAPAGDITADALSVVKRDPGPWTTTDNPFGANGALAVRLLQMGAPVVSLTVGFWDSHANEVIDGAARRPHTAQAVLLGRLLSGLAFALKRIQDPTAPRATLWDGTVIVVCSEFGRGGDKVGANGFNTPNGENGGGSDHDPWSAWPLLGGPVAAARAGGRLLVDSRGGGFFEQTRVFTTLMKGMGVEPGRSTYLPFGQFPPIPGLVDGVRA